MDAFNEFNPASFHGIERVAKRERKKDKPGFREEPAREREKALLYQAEGERKRKPKKLLREKEKEEVKERATARTSQFLFLVHSFSI